MKKVIDPTQSRINSLKAKIRRLKKKLVELDEKEALLLQIPADQRTLLNETDLAMIKLDRGNINLKITTYEYSIKELEDWFANMQSTNQQS